MIEDIEDLTYFEPNEQMLNEDLKDFVNNYLKEHTYFRCRSMAKIYLEQSNIEKRDKILRSVSSRISQIFRPLVKKSKMIKYSPGVYKKL